jgi:hypothetical protein
MVTTVKIFFTWNTLGNTRTSNRWCYMSKNDYKAQIVACSNHMNKINFRISMMCLILFYFISTLENSLCTVNGNVHATLIGWVHFFQSFYVTCNFRNSLKTAISNWKLVQDLSFLRVRPSNMCWLSLSHAVNTHRMQHVQLTACESRARNQKNQATEGRVSPIKRDYQH